MDIKDLKKVSKLTKKTVSRPLLITSSRKSFDVTHPKEDAIDINDIALALSNECRWGGHAGFYSVAQHSTLVASCLPFKYFLHGLLHDAAEAYLKDIPTPLKSKLPFYKKLEKRYEEVIYSKYGVVWTAEAKRLVKAADALVAKTEGNQFFPNVFEWLPRLDLPKVRADTPTEAEKYFLKYFNYAMTQRDNPTVPEDYIMANELKIIF